MMLCLRCIHGCAILMIAGLALPASAQIQRRDTVWLGPVQISGSRTKLFAEGKLVTLPDSASRDLDIHDNAGGFFTEQCGLFVKSYGQGGSATVTSRGTEARHTAVLWNGFNINSPSLGVSDLSLVPLAHFDGFSFVHGGSSQVHGNASVGGALVLENTEPDFNGMNRIACHAEAGSFGMMNLLAGLQFSGTLINSKTTLFRQSSQNNFEYTNIAKKDHPEETLWHASSLNYGLIQDLSFRISENQLISAALWYQAADREIPPLMTASIANATQADTLLRCFAGYRLSGRRTILEVKAAWFDERQVYDDARQITAYRYHVSTWNGEVSARISVSRNFLLHGGVSAFHSAADFREYTKEEERMSVSPFAGIRWEFGKEWRFDAHVRKEFTNLKDGPVSPVAAIHGKPVPGIVHVSASAGRHYALPTMNDLYWVPGGNPDLQPEDARSGELGIVLFSDFHGFPRLSVTSYLSRIRNWIRWQPSAGGIYAPDNLREMEAYGIESAMQYTKKFTSITCTLTGRYNYSRSSLREAEQDAESALTGKQLTYTPLHMFSGQASLIWRKVSVVYRHQYTGERFTTGDNKSSLDGFQLAFLALDYQFTVLKSNCTAYAKINNLYNNSYQVMAYYPAPGRWYSAGLKLEIPFKPTYKKS